MPKFAILGAGMAGLEVASRLSDEDVLILDAAESGPPAIVTEREWCEPQSDVETWWPHQGSNHPRHFSTNFGLRRRLGGRSLCWHGVSLDIPTYAFDGRWSAEAVGWVTDKGASFRRHLEAVSAELEVDSAVAPAEYQVVPRMVSRHPRPYRTDGVYTPVDRFSDVHTRFRPRTLVRGISKQAGTFQIDILADGETGSIQAENVVLACGALHNGSFIRPFLKTTRPPRIYDHVVIGRSMVSTEFSSEPGDGLYYREVAALKVRFFLDLRWRDRGLEVDFWTMAADGGVYVAEIVGPIDHPQVHFTDRGLCSRTEALQVAVDVEFARVLDALGCSGWTLDGWDQVRPTHRAILEFRDGGFERNRALCFESALGSTDHDHGTAPFGVVDQWGELRDAPGLHVVGPSTFPTLGGANPSLASIAQARVVGDVLKAR